jgi:hypothetical protein
VSPPKIRFVAACNRSGLSLIAGFYEQAATIARTGGVLADASLQLTSAAAGHLLVGDPPGAIPLTREALALARQIAHRVSHAGRLCALRGLEQLLELGRRAIHALQGPVIASGWASSFISRTAPMVNFATCGNADAFCYRPYVLAERSKRKPN